MQDFKDAIAIYPDLSNVRYGSHFFYIGLSCYFTRQLTQVSYHLCRLKDLELLLRDVVPASQNILDFSQLHEAGLGTFFCKIYEGCYPLHLSYVKNSPFPFNLPHTQGKRKGRRRKIHKIKKKWLVQRALVLDRNKCVQVVKRMK